VTDAALPLVLPGPFLAAIFDMDGLLLDTEPLWAQAEGELLVRHGDRLTEADREATHGRGLAESVAIYAERLGGLDPAVLESELTGLMRDHYESGPALQPGAEALVRRLEGRMRGGADGPDA
jgi:beta-phosphoglucomutase-like phosphatase (HAD superfamily)